MSENKYTAADFAAAEFAEHPDGSLAVRMHPDYPMPWRVVAGSQPIWFAGDREMTMDGWVPVSSSPAKPTITAGEVGRRSHLVRGDNVETPSLVDFLEALGIEVVPTRRGRRTLSGWKPGCRGSRWKPVYRSVSWRRRGSRRQNWLTGWTSAE